ncbi:hypothetical protein SAHY_07717 [Salinisphaera hydrothermalis EPR70]
MQAIGQSHMKAHAAAMASAVDVVDIEVQGLLPFPMSQTASMPRADAPRQICLPKKNGPVNGAVSALATREPGRRQPGSTNRY